MPITIPWGDYGAVDATSMVIINVNLAGQSGTVRGAPLSRIRSIYIDNTNSSATIYVQFPDTLHTVYALPNSSGWYPVLTNVVRFVVYAEGFEAGAIPTTVIQATNLDRQGFLIPAATVITPITGINGFYIDPDPGAATAGLWDLDVDGALTLSTAGVWTITPLPLFNADVELYGPGGSSGALWLGSGGSLIPASAGVDTTFAGMRAKAGGVSLGGDDDANISTAGGVGGVASGGDVNTNGNAGEDGNSDSDNKGGDGAAAPGPAGGAAVSALAVPADGVVGNAPGGGAAGPGSAGFPWLIFIGGGGSGAYVKTTYAVGTLAAGTPYTLTVGGPGAAGSVTGSPSVKQNGAQGAVGRAIFTAA